MTSYDSWKYADAGAVPAPEDREAAFLAAADDLGLDEFVRVVKRLPLERAVAAINALTGGVVPGEVEAAKAEWHIAHCKRPQCPECEKRGGEAVSRKPSPFAAADQLAYRNALIRELRDQRSRLVDASRAILAILAGAIEGWTPQPLVMLGPIRFRPDFRVAEEGGVEHYVDVKGAMTQRFRDVCKLWREHGPARLLVVRKGGVETIEAKGVAS